MKEKEERYKFCDECRCSQIVYFIWKVNSEGEPKLEIRCPKCRNLINKYDYV